MAGFLQGSDTIDVSRIPGRADPVVSLAWQGANTMVRMTWYASPPVAGQPLPAHVDADMVLANVHLTSFVRDVDFHIVG